MAVAVQTELVINYSVGMKANIGNYESADAHVSRTEKYNVEGMAKKAIDSFFADRYEAMQGELGEIIADKFEQLHNGEI